MLHNPAQGSGRLPTGGGTLVRFDFQKMVPAARGAAGYEAGDRTKVFVTSDLHTRSYRLVRIARLPPRWSKECSREDLHLELPSSQDGVQGSYTSRAEKGVRHAGDAPARCLWKRRVLLLHQ